MVEFFIVFVIYVKVNVEIFKIFGKIEKVMLKLVWYWMEVFVVYI